MTAPRCHWVRSTDEDGHEVTILIPGCWGRVHDPEGECTCGEWSEETARAMIRSLRAAIFRERHTTQQLRAALSLNNIADPTMPAHTTAEYTARRRRRDLHRSINEAVENHDRPRRTASAKPWPK